MGLIQAFAPGSIRSVWDMRRALGMVLDDLFDEVGSTGCSGKDSVDFLIEDTGLDLEIRVVDRDDPGTCEEQHLIFAWRESGLSLRDALMAIEGMFDAENSRADTVKLIQQWKSLGVPVPEPLLKAVARFLANPDEDDDYEPFVSPTAGKDEPVEPPPVDATPSVVGPAKRQRPRRPEGDPVPDREISPYTFSRVIDREMIGRIRDVEAALAERDRDREDEEAEARFQKAARRFRDVYQNANAFEEGFEFVFEGKIWHFGTDNDGSLICFFNYAIVLTDADAPTRNTDDDPDEGDTPTSVGETPSDVVRLGMASLATTSIN
jgi:hypothetical protein